MILGRRISYEELLMHERMLYHPLQLLLGIVFIKRDLMLDMSASDRHFALQCVIHTLICDDTVPDTTIH